MGAINLDALVGEEEAGEPNTISFKGEEFLIPARMPAAFVVEVSRFAKEASSQLDGVKAGSTATLADALAAVFGPDQWQAFLALRPSDTALMALVNAISELYTSQQMGESRGSAGNSPNTRGPRKLTSSVTTGSTSTEPHENTA